LQGINIDLNITGASKVNKQMQQVAKTTEKVTKNVAQGRDMLGEFGKAGALAAKRFAAFSIATAGFIAFVSAIRNGAKAAIDFERQMIRISQVTGVSMNGLKDLKNTISDLSTGLGVSSEKLVDISRVLAQTGMSARDTKTALEALAKTELAPTFTNIQKTTEAAIAAMRQFNIEAGKLEQTLGQMNSLAANFAVEADDLGVVIRRAGGAFKSAGGDLLELEALFTSVRSTTRESAETIATGFRTIFTRMRRPKTIGFLKELGVNLEDMTGKFVGPYEAVRRLNAALSELDPRDTRYAQIIEELGGFRQVSKVIPLIQQFEKAELARATAIRGSTSLTKDSISAQDALAVRLIKLKESFAELMRQIMDNRGIQLFIDMSLRLAEALLKIAKALEPLIPLIAVLGASALFKGAGRLMGGVKGGLGFNKGGVVPGTGNTDSVPANLTPGEFVIRKGAASRIGTDNLHAMNKYAAGGVVRKGRHGYGPTATFSMQDGMYGGFFMSPVPAQDKKGKRSGAKAVQTPYTDDALKAIAARLPGKQTAGMIRKIKGLTLKAKTIPYEGMIDPEVKKKIETTEPGGLIPQVKEATRKAATDLAKSFNISGLDFSDISQSIDNIDFDSVGGHLFEGIISHATGAALSGEGAGFDFKDIRTSGQRQNLAQLFGTIPGQLLHADAKRSNTSGAKGEIKDKIANIFGGGATSNVSLAESKATLSLKGFPKRLLPAGDDDAPKTTPVGLGDDKDKRQGPPVARVRRRAQGGIVDSVPALLTPGEFVVNKASAQAIGYGNLKHINKYAAGGVVRKGRGNYGPTGGEGGGGLGMLFAMDMAMGFAATLVDAESKFGAFLNTLIKVTSAFMAYQMLIKQGNVVKKTDIAATKMMGQTGTSTGGFRGKKGTPIIAPGGLQQQHVAPGRVWSPGGKVMPESITPSQPRGVPGQVIDAPGKWNKAKRMMGEKNARRLGKGMAWASDKTRKAGENMEKFGGKALIAGMLLGQLGSMLKGMGMAELKESGGESGGALAIAGGALSGAAMGGAAGMAVGGPIGAAIGAVGGGLYGLATTIKEVSETIEKIKIDKGMETLSDAFRDVSMGWADIGSIGPEVEQSLAALNVGAHGSAAAQEHAAQAAKQSMPKYMKAIKAFAAESDTMDDFFSRMDEGSLRTFANLNSLPYDKLRKDIENQIQANKEAAVAARLLKESHLELERIERSMSVIDRAVSGASAQIEDFGRAIDASMKTIKAPDLAAGILDRPGGLTQREMDSGGRLDQQLAALTSLLPKRAPIVGGGGAMPSRMAMMTGATGPREPELAATARENIKGLSELDSALNRTRTEIGEMTVGGKKAFETFENELSKKAAPGAVKAIMSGLRGSFKDEDEFAKAVRDPSERGKIQKAAERDLKRQLETLKRLGKFINKASKELAKAFQARTKLEQELVKEVGKLVTLQQQRFETMKKIRGQGKVTPEESEKFFQKKQAARLGAVGEGGLAAGGQVDVAQLGGRYRELNKRIMDTTAQMNKFGEGLQGGEDELDRRIRLNDQIADDTSKLKTLGTVIADYQNVQQRTAALQEKINQLNQQAAKRRSMVDQYAGATDESRAEMDRVADMARRIADGTEQFANVPQDMRGQVISFVQDMASQGGPIGDKFEGAAGDIRVQTARDMGIKLTPDMEKQLRAKPTSEVEKLGKEIDKAFQNAITLQADAIIAGITDQQAVLNTALEALKTVITDALPRALKEQAKADNEAMVGELQSQTRVLLAQLLVLEDLRAMGVDTSDPNAIRSVKKIAEMDMVGEAARSQATADMAGPAMAAQEAWGSWTSASLLSHGAGDFSKKAGMMFPVSGEKISGSMSEQAGPGAAWERTKTLFSGEGGWDALSAGVLRQGAGETQGEQFMQAQESMFFSKMVENMVQGGKKDTEGKTITQERIMEDGVMQEFMQGTKSTADVLEDFVKRGVVSAEDSHAIEKYLAVFTQMKQSMKDVPSGPFSEEKSFNTGVLVDLLNAGLERVGKEAQTTAKADEQRLLSALKRSGITDPKKQKEFIRDFKEKGPKWEERLKALPDDVTEGGVKGSIDANKTAIDTLNTTNSNLDATIKILNDRLQGVGAGGKRAALDGEVKLPSGRGTPGELPGGLPSDAIVSADLADPDLQNKYAQAGLHTGSIFTHDVHVEAAINNLSFGGAAGGAGGGMMSGMTGGGAAGAGWGAFLNPMNWFGGEEVGPGPAERAGARRGLGSRLAGDAPGTGIAPGGGRPDGITPTAGNGIAMASAPEMDKWTKSMTSLSNTMTAFTAAFEGGMVWTIEGKHDIDVNLNGAEVFASLPEMFQTLVMTQTRAVLKKYVSEYFPHLAVGSTEALGKD
jgi:TP901 family phage tail tape measure protein